jgi:hypothetical protein
MACGLDEYEVRVLMYLIRKFNTATDEGYNSELLAKRFRGEFKGKHINKVFNETMERLIKKHKLITPIRKKTLKYYLSDANTARSLLYKHGENVPPPR